jgi:hypothetical protein
MNFAQTVGQIQRSVDNILVRIITNRRTIQHATQASLPELTAAQKIQALGSYLKDLGEIAEACRKPKPSPTLASAPVRTHVEPSLSVPEFFRPKPKPGPSVSGKSQSLGLTKT